MLQDTDEAGRGAVDLRQPTKFNVNAVTICAPELR